MKEFRIAVERIVRPVSAGRTRKNRMREELLGHLVRSYEEELARGAVLQTAQRAVIERLGDPVVLRQTFQDTVPRWEQACNRRVGSFEMFDIPWLDRRGGETALYHATRWGALFAGVVTPTVLLTAVICTTAKIVRGRAYEGLLAEILASAYAWLTAAVSVFAAAFVGALIFEACGLLKRTNLKSDMNPWLKATCWLFMSATIAISGVVIFVMFMPSARFRLAIETWMAFRNSMSLLDIIVAAALAVCGFILVGWIMGLEKRDYDDWGSLQIDD